MKNLFYFLCLVLSGHTYSGDGVGNGAGLAETNIISAYYGMKDYLPHTLSLDVSMTRLNKVELKTLEKINNSLDDEYQTERPIVFLSNRAFEARFNGQFRHLRVAATYNRIGSRIYFNSDLIYGRNGKSPLSLSEAINIIVHELGHHHGIIDEELLYSLGAKVSMAVKKNIRKRPLMNHKNIIFQYVNLGEEGFPQMQLIDGEQSFDLVEDLESKVNCMNNIAPKSINIAQSAWMRRNFSQDFYIQNWVGAKCGDELLSLEYIVFPRFEFKNGKLRIMGTPTTTITNCSIGNSSCLKNIENFYMTKEML